jgi:hypothetical protein
MSQNLKMRNCLLLKAGSKANIYLKRALHFVLSTIKMVLSQTVSTDLVISKTIRSKK